MCIRAFYLFQIKYYSFAEWQHENQKQSILFDDTATRKTRQGEKRQNKENERTMEMALVNIKHE